MQRRGPSWYEKAPWGHRHKNSSHCRHADAQEVKNYIFFYSILSPMPPDKCIFYAGTKCQLGNYSAILFDTQIRRIPLIFCSCFFFQNNTVVLDFDYFVRLFEHYYLSDDPSDLGNFINGKLDFLGDGDDEDSSDDEALDPGLLDHRVNSSTSIHSMDDDLRLPADGASMSNNGQERSKSTIRLHEDGPVKRICQTFQCCCIS